MQVMLKNMESVGVTSDYAAVLALEHYARHVAGVHQYFFASVVISANPACFAWRVQAVWLDFGACVKVTCVHVDMQVP
jgi:hypothetical protein